MYPLLTSLQYNGYALVIYNGDKNDVVSFNVYCELKL